MNICGDGEEECIKHHLLVQSPTRLALVVVFADSDWAQWFCPQLLSQSLRGNLHAASPKA